MNPDLLSANISLVFLGVVAVAMLAHLSQLAGKRRFQHAIYAATAAGLAYLFGGKALGWNFIPREALLALYAGLFAIVAGLAVMRRGEESEIMWGGLLVELAALAYIFAPLAFWKPPLSALLFIYFLLELFNWLKGREEAVGQGAPKDHRPPLFPPRRVRGVREFAAAAAAAALVYVFAMGTGRAPVPSAPEEASTEQPAESVASPEATAPGESQTAEASGASEEQTSTETVQAPGGTASTQSPTAPAASYVAKPGDTLKSIARKLYRKKDRLAALIAANPGVKPMAKLKAGQVIKLPEPAARQ